MTTHLRVTATAFAVVLAMTASACSGGSDDKSDGSDRPSGPSSSPASTGVLADAGAVQKTLDDYTTRNNAVIARVTRPPWNAKLWESPDAGAVLAVDRFATTADRKLRRQDKPIGFTVTLQRAFVPAPSAGRRFFLVTTSSKAVALRPHVKVPKQHTYPKWTGVSAFEQVDGQWRNFGGVSIRRTQLPVSLDYGDASTPDSAQVATVHKLAGQLATYWRTGRKPAGFASTKWIDYPRTQRQKQFGKGFGRVDVEARLFDQNSVWAVRVQGGVLAVASYQLHEISIVTKANAFGYFSGDTAAVFGSDRRPRLEYPTVGITAFFVPDHGKARPLGFHSNAALF